MKMNAFQVKSILIVNTCSCMGACDNKIFQMITGKSGILEIRLNCSDLELGLCAVL